jgi:hypothetical protein
MRDEHLGKRRLRMEYVNHGCFLQPHDEEFGHCCDSGYAPFARTYASKLFGDQPPQLHGPFLWVPVCPFLKSLKSFANRRP